MSEKRFQVIFTGEIKNNLDRDTVIGNLVLTTDLSHDKAERLLCGSEVVLKRLTRLADAQLLAVQFEKAGAICKVHDKAQAYIKESQKKKGKGPASTIKRLISTVQIKKSNKAK